MYDRSGFYVRIYWNKIVDLDTSSFFMGQYRKGSFVFILYLSVLNGLFFLKMFPVNY